MTRKALRFRQAELARALRAVKQADASLSVEVLPDGTIRFTPIPPQEGQSGDGEVRREPVL